MNGQTVQNKKLIQLYSCSLFFSELNTDFEGYFVKSQVIKRCEKCLSLEEEMKLLDLIDNLNESE
jgi:hypothetical protein